jgi:hypothetical protein
MSRTANTKYGTVKLGSDGLARVQSITEAKVKHEIKVGQTVYRPGAGKLQAYTVTKVGRQWAYFGYRSRFDIETLAIDWNGNGGSPGKVYLSEDAYHTEKAVSEAWSALTKAFYQIRWRAPAGVTVEDIAQARALLKIDPA